MDYPVKTSILAMLELIAMFGLVTMSGHEALYSITPVYDTGVQEIPIHVVVPLPPSQLNDNIHVCTLNVISA